MWRRSPARTSRKRRRCARRRDGVPLRDERGARAAHLGRKRRRGRASAGAATTLHSPPHRRPAAEQRDGERTRYSAVASCRPQTGGGGEGTCHRALRTGRVGRDDQPCLQATRARARRARAAVVRARDQRVRVVFGAMVAELGHDRARRRPRAVAPGPQRRWLGRHAGVLARGGAAADLLRRGEWRRHPDHRRSHQRDARGWIPAGSTRA